MGKSCNTFKSFTELSGFLKKRPDKSFEPEKKPRFEGKDEAVLTQKDEAQAFLKAMSGVTPLLRKNSRRSLMPASNKSAQPLIDTGEKETACLENLVKSGAGFAVCQTSEYIEGTGYRVPPAMADRLHRGDFAVQSHIDLHGLGVELAKEALDRFLRESIRTGRRQALIIHGRGLSSPGKPILKTRIREWLTTGPWRKWVIAYSSARMCDGGAGATYVLLRSRPLTRRFKNRSRRKASCFSPKNRI